MFRASDIFGRRPGKAPNKPLAAAKAGAAQKRPEPDSGPRTGTWDPATGKYTQEEVPQDIQELMGIKKRFKTEAQPEQDEREAWSNQDTAKKQPRVLGPSAVGFAAKGRPATVVGAPPGPVDTDSPSVEYRGFSKVDLNERYYERPEVPVNGRPTYWSGDSQFFLYWQGEVQRWSICDGASFPAVKAGQLPGWAYKQDHRHLCQASGWMEAWNGEWREPELEVIFRSTSHHKPQWDDPIIHKSITTVEFHGFSMKELNTRYFLRAEETIQGRPSYWDMSGVYFLYWQQQTRRWAICDLKCIDAVREGQCPGWAYRADSSHFANACGWMESRSNQWVDAIVETAVVGSCTKGLKVEFSGFSKPELNTTYVEKAEEQIQGRASFWDLSGTYFVYWQSSMRRWAICDRVSLQPARSGLTPGWAYRTDSQHFAKSSSWMESWGREWRSTNVTCLVLEGTVKDNSGFVKQEQTEGGDEPGTQLSAEQYKALITKVYEDKNPDKLPDLPHLFDRYEGREHELFRQACDKYEVNPDEIAADLPDLGTEAKPEDGDEFAHLESEDLPHLSATEYAVLIQSVYERYNPKKLQDMGRLLQRYRNRERELYHEVCKKYGAHPAKFHAKQVKEQQAEGAN